MSQSRLWKEQEVADFLQKSVHWVRKDRYTKRLIPFVKLGSDVRYIPEAVVEAAQADTRGGATPARSRRVRAGQAAEVAA